MKGCCLNWGGEILSGNLGENVQLYIVTDWCTGTAKATFFKCYVSFDRGIRRTQKTGELECCVGVFSPPLSSFRSERCYFRGGGGGGGGSSLRKKEGGRRKRGSVEGRKIGNVWFPVLLFGREKEEKEMIKGGGSFSRLGPCQSTHTQTLTLVSHTRRRHTCLPIETPRFPRNTPGRIMRAGNIVCIDTWRTTLECPEIIRCMIFGRVFLGISTQSICLRSKSQAQISLQKTPDNYRTQLK